MSDSTNDVAVALTDICDLAEHLREQAVHHASSRLMPGGLAMVALGPALAADDEEWLEYVSHDEFHHYAKCHRSDHTRCLTSTHLEDGGDEWEPPLQTLLFWSEGWRSERGSTMPKRPTISSEAKFLHGSLNWAWQRELHWEDFAADVQRCRTRLENLLCDGERPVLGVPCMYDECKGKRMRRELEKTKGGRWALTDWFCPVCKRSYNERTYIGLVTKAAEAAKREEIGGEIWCSQDYASGVVNRSVKTIRTWIEDGRVVTACIVKGRRKYFVRLADVEREDAEAKRRRRERVVA